MTMFVEQVYYIYTTVVSRVQGYPSNIMLSWNTKVSQKFRHVDKQNNIEDALPTICIDFIAIFFNIISQ